MGVKPASIGGPIRVFISYSHDSPEHAEQVLKLSNKLRSQGVDCHLDQYEMSPYENGGRNDKFIPVVFGAADVKFIPRFLRQFANYDFGSTALLASLTQAKQQHTEAGET